MIQPDHPVVTCELILHDGRQCNKEAVVILEVLGRDLALCSHHGYVETRNPGLIEKVGLNS